MNLSSTLDRSLQSPFSPRARATISSRRVLPGFQTPSKAPPSTRSVHLNQVILKSSKNYAERFGESLPVLVTEAIIFADKNVLLSARISKCGYAWVVCGRRLLIWQYRQSVTQNKPLVNNQCFELQLPQSDLAHRAELVSVFTSSTSAVPSCIAVSPEGVVRYWPSVIHDGVSVEQAVDLQGQECDSLTEIGELGCILATTTCSVVWVQPSALGSRASLTCRAFRMPTGWLGGLSRRISSFIFGPMSADPSTETV
uniref:Nucleoporin Nup133/Nup155-like N-terminal domain-containing protein n=1 Tax=Photinus pyralis TaxID=7054 RepID=A0A1Y1KN49_PHOPY